MDEKTPTTRRAYQLPKVESPSLEGLEVTLQSPIVTADDLMDALHKRLRSVSDKRERKPGELIAPGDDVVFDIITIVDGKTVSGGVSRKANFEVREFLHLPGFIDHIIGMETFTAKTFELALPQDYPVEGLAGKVATYYLENHRAVEVEASELDDTALLTKAGLGENLEEAMEKLAGELDEDQGRQLLIEASQASLSALASRVAEQIPEAAVEEELCQLWQKSDAFVFEGKPFSEAFVEAARSDFLADPDRRQEAEERIRTGLALGALIESENIEPSEDVLEELLSTICEQLKMSVEEAKESLKTDRQDLQTVGQLALYQEAVAFVVARTKFNIAEPTNSA